jgi:hypothetical protein
MDVGHDDVDRPPLHDAARFGSRTDVANLIRSSEDIDALWWGRTALWEAVVERRKKVACELVDAGADPWRHMPGGWSPGRLNLAGRTPDLFGAPPDGVALSPDEQAAVAESQRLIRLLKDAETDGRSVACVAGIDAAEAARRLQAEPADDVEADALIDEWFDTDMPDDELIAIVGVTDVPGGCVVTQWWGYAPSTPGVMTLLTPGTVGYGMYGNPKSGNQGKIFRDGACLDWDLHPGGGDAAPDDSPEEVLRAYLYIDHAFAYCCNYAGIRPTDARAFNGPPDRWLRLPPMEYWPGHN